jgi:uncharacterized protein
MNFEWDKNKEIENLRKHKVAFTEAVESFYDPMGIVLRDNKHSAQEKRWYWVGESKANRVLTTWYTQRGARIRIIGSAEWRKFRRLYETAKIK